MAARTAAVGRPRSPRIAGACRRASWPTNSPSRCSAPARLPEASRLAHCVSASGHARAERAVVVGVTLFHRVLLLRLIARLRLLLHLDLAHAPEAAEQGADAGTDRRPFAGIAADRTADRAQRGTA